MKVLDLPCVVARQWVNVGGLKTAVLRVSCGGRRLWLQVLLLHVSLPALVVSTSAFLWPVCARLALQL